MVLLCHLAMLAVWLVPMIRSETLEPPLRLERSGLQFGLASWGLRAWLQVEAGLFNWEKWVLLCHWAVLQLFEHTPFLALRSRWCSVVGWGHHGAGMELVLRAVPAELQQWC